MKSVFVDTNVFLRLILGDVVSQQLVARKIFEDGAAAKIKLKSSVIVLFEIYWVLKSGCGLEGAELVNKLKQILQLAVEFENRDLLFESVAEMEKYGFDLEDAYNAIYSKKIDVDRFETFDKKLRRKVG